MSHTLLVIQAICYGLYVLAAGSLIISGVGYCICAGWDTRNERRWRIVSLIAAIVLILTGAVHAVIIHLP